MLIESYTFFKGCGNRTNLFSRAIKKRKSKLSDKAILPKLDEEYEVKQAALKDLLIEN